MKGFESSSPSVGVRGCGKDGGLMLAGINHVIWPPNKADLSAAKGNVMSRTGVWKTTCPVLARARVRNGVKFWATPLVAQR